MDIKKSPWRKVLIAVGALVVVAGLAVGVVHVVDRLAPRVTISFDTAGGEDLDPLVVKLGTQAPSLPSASNGQGFFVGWYFDGELTQPITRDHAFEADTTLHASYQDAGVNDATRHFADVSSDVSFVVRTALDLSSEDVRLGELIEVVCADGSPVEIVLEQVGDDRYEVRPVQGYVPGYSYKVALLDMQRMIMDSFNGQSMEGQANSGYSFTVYRENEANIEMKSGVKFVGASAADELAEQESGATFLYAFYVDPAATPLLAQDVICLGASDDEGGEGEYLVVDSVTPLAREGAFSTRIEATCASMQDVYDTLDFYYSGEVDFSSVGDETIAQMELSIEEQMRDPNGPFQQMLADYAYAALDTEAVKALAVSRATGGDSIVPMGFDGGGSADDEQENAFSKRLKLKYETTEDAEGNTIKKQEIKFDIFGMGGASYNAEIGMEGATAVITAYVDNFSFTVPKTTNAKLTLNLELTETITSTVSSSMRMTSEEELDENSDFYVSLDEPLKQVYKGLLEEYENMTPAEFKRAYGVARPVDVLCYSYSSQVISSSFDLKVGVMLEYIHPNKGTQVVDITSQIGKLAVMAGNTAGKAAASWALSESGIKDELYSDGLLPGSDLKYQDMFKVAINMFGVMDMNVDISLVASFAAQAALDCNLHVDSARLTGTSNGRPIVDYSYFDETTQTLGRVSGIELCFDTLEFNETLGSQTSYSVSLKGAVGVRMGVRVSLGISPTGMAKVMYLGLSVEAGGYMKMSGFVALSGSAMAASSQKSSELTSLAGGIRLEAGVCVQLNFDWRFVLWKGSTALAKKEFPFHTLDYISSVASWKNTEEEPITFTTRQFNVLANQSTADEPHYLGALVKLDLLEGAMSDDFLNPKTTKFVLTVKDAYKANVGHITIDENGLINIPDGVDTLVRMELLMVSTEYLSAVETSVKNEEMGYRLAKTVELTFTPTEIAPEDVGKSYTTNFHAQLPDGTTELIYTMKSEVGRPAYAPVAEVSDWFANSLYFSPIGSYTTWTDVNGVPTGIATMFTQGTQDYYTPAQPMTSEVTYYGLEYNQSTDAFDTVVLKTELVPLGQTPTPPTEKEVLAAMGLVDIEEFEGNISFEGWDAEITPITYEVRENKYLVRYANPSTGEVRMVEQVGRGTFYDERRIYTARLKVGATVTFNYDGQTESAFYTYGSSITPPDVDGWYKDEFYAFERWDADVITRAGLEDKTYEAVFATRPSRAKVQITSKYYETYAERRILPSFYVQLGDTPLRGLQDIQRRFIDRGAVPDTVSQRVGGTHFRLKLAGIADRDDLMERKGINVDYRALTASDMGKTFDMELEFELEMLEQAVTFDTTGTAFTVVKDEVTRGTTYAERGYALSPGLYTNSADLRETSVDYALALPREFVGGNVSDEELLRRYSVPGAVCVNDEGYSFTVTHWRAADGTVLETGHMYSLSMGTKTFVPYRFASTSGYFLTFYSGSRDNILFSYQTQDQNLWVDEDFVNARLPLQNGAVRDGIRYYIEGYDAQLPLRIGSKLQMMQSYEVRYLRAADVAFDANGGTFEGGASTLVKEVTERQSRLDFGGSQSETVAVFGERPLRAGFSFVGWATSASATAVDVVSSFSPVMKAGQVLYAVWVVAPAYETVTMDANGGAFDDGQPTSALELGQNEELAFSGAAIPGQRVVFGSVPARASDQNKYVFAGWGTTPDTTEVISSYTLPAYATRTLYAVWTAEPRVQVYFDAGNAGGKIEGTNEVSEVRSYDVGATLNTVRYSSLPADHLLLADESSPDYISARIDYADGGYQIANSWDLLGNSDVVLTLEAGREYRLVAGYAKKVFPVTFLTGASTTFKDGSTQKTGRFIAENPLPDTASEFASQTLMFDLPLMYEQGGVWYRFTQWTLWSGYVSGGSMTAPQTLAAEYEPAAQSVFFGIYVLTEGIDVVNAAGQSIIKKDAHGFPMMPTIGATQTDAAPVRTLADGTLSGLNDQLDALWLFYEIEGDATVHQVPAGDHLEAYFNEFGEVRFRTTNIVHP